MLIRLALSLWANEDICPNQKAGAPMVGEIETIGRVAPVQNLLEIMFRSFRSKYVEVACWCYQTITSTQTATVLRRGVQRESMQEESKEMSLLNFHSWEVILQNSDIIFLEAKISYVEVTML